ncbi:hypothetical protein D7V97_15645 [Corallococcus sp. CA053C]|uniref:hypothetical protein n=1 Tax=Corallococcus sp. CA053C TaxID=2316732 RepID=UPI000EA1BE61|nr:hypothetical protein [Corallococcus sp. CA053C]RKH09744.1 hypothetical protein D7V97_15645 [Corallococcus sp. CA053C]
MKLTGQSPDEVRAWDHEDLLGLLAYCELENEELKQRTQHHPRPAGASSHAPASGTTTITYRFAPKPSPKPKR